MNSYELETTIAGPVQVLGMSFYFDPDTAAAAKEHELNVFEFYGVGRGGVLGNVEAVEVGEAFWFFHQNAIDGLWGAGTAKASADATTVAESYLRAAYAYADKTFAGVERGTLEAFAAAARVVIDAVPADRYALFDGYRRFPVPADPLHAAYLATIALRELRGGVHIEATRACGIAANEACFISNEMIFELHGYSEADAPERTDDLVSRMRDAEDRTDQTMAGYLDVLSDAQRQAIADGVAAMNEQLQLAQGAAQG
jgi:hypothetical protein